MENSIEHKLEPELAIYDCQIANYGQNEKMKKKFLSLLFIKNLDMAIRSNLFFSFLRISKRKEPVAKIKYDAKFFLPKLKAEVDAYKKSIQGFK